MVLPDKQIFSSEFKLWRKNKNLMILFLIIFLICCFVFYQTNSFAQQAEKSFRSDIIALEQQAQENGMELNFDFESSEGKGMIQDAITSINPSNGFKLVLATNSLLLPIIMGFFGCILLGSEYKYRTLHIKYSHFGKRNVLHSKMLTVTMISILLVVSSFLLGIIFSHINWRLLKSNDLMASYAVNNDLFSMDFYLFATPILGIIFYGLLGIMITLVSQKLIIGCVMVFALPYIEKFSYFSFLPSNLYSSLMTNNFSAYTGSIVSLDTTMIPTSNRISVLGLLVWISILIIIVQLNAKLVKEVKY